LYVVVTIKSDTGEVVGEMLANEKQFKTGSRGFYANAKFDIQGKRYQAQIQLVEVGSKAAAAAQ
jgi:hypothetical protein